MGSPTSCCRTEMLSIDLTGKRAFVAGVGDDRGYGWAIVRALVGAGAAVRVGTWPPMLNIFTKSLERGKFDLSLPGGGEIEFEKIHPLDASFDTPFGRTRDTGSSRVIRSRRLPTPSGTNWGRIAWTSWSMRLRMARK